MNFKYTSNNSKDCWYINYPHLSLHHLSFDLARVITLQICIVVMCLLVCISHPAQTRRLQPCELAGQLYILDIPKVELPLWLCIAEFESRFNTDVIGNRNQDGSLDYGIFQISDKFWCKPKNVSTIMYHYYNECDVDCVDLIKDDITQAVKCAKRIKQKQGWNAWSVYEEFCNGTNTPSSSLFDDLELEQCFS